MPEKDITSIESITPLRPAAKSGPLLGDGHQATITQLYPNTEVGTTEVLEDNEPLIDEVLENANGTELFSFYLTEGSNTMYKVDAGLRAKGHKLTDRTSGYKRLGRGDQPEGMGWFSLVIGVPKEQQNSDPDEPIESVMFRPQTDTVEEADNEPQVNVVYRFDGRKRWTDERGVPNRHFALSIDLPESVAFKLKTALTDNPKLIRKIVRMAALRYGIPEDVWDHSEMFNGREQTLRPPYESLDDSLQPIVFG